MVPASGSTGQGERHDRHHLKRIARHEWRVYRDGDIVGDVLRMPDILKRGAMLFVIHLDEDFRGPVRVHDCNRVREVTERMVRTHPFHG